MALFWIIVHVHIGIVCLLLSVFFFSEPFLNHWSTFVIGNVEQYYRDPLEPLESRCWNGIASAKVYWGQSCERKEGMEAELSKENLQPMMAIWHLWKERGGGRGSWIEQRGHPTTVHIWQSHSQPNNKVQRKDFPSEESQTLGLRPCSVMAEGCLPRKFLCSEAKGRSWKC